MDIEKKRQVELLSREAIADKVRELGDIITEDYKGKKLIVVSLLKGAFIFTADLVREIKIPLIVDFMITSSYGHNEESSGSVQVIQDIDKDLTGYDVLIVDDIADTGTTMDFVIGHLKAKNADSVKACVLLDKPSRRKVELEPEYIGFTIPDKFIVGYGLNYGDYYRNIPYVFAFED